MVEVRDELMEIRKRQGKSHVAGRGHRNSKS
jgi:hypothetical protein